MPAASLQDRIRAFLPTRRLGIDFGEHTGGIALLRGNTILHAETYLDFHQATLEQRRLLRRGRRTRHAKRMRLARLRSWILRQSLPGGPRLPDPYAVMRDARYMVQPGIFQKSGTSPHTAPSWVELAKKGQVSPAGFVRALTLIFQKRGYKWDPIELQQMTDARLADFLQSARIPSDNLAQQIHTLIDLRKHDPNHPARGRKKVPPHQLETLLADARQRLQGGTLPPFRYRDKGTLAVIGRNSAVAASGSLRFHGLFAWLVWAMVHIYYLIEFDNKLLVMIQWAWNYFTRKRGARLITGEATLPDFKRSV